MPLSDDWLLAIDLQPAFSRPGSPWFTPGAADASQVLGRLAPLFGDRVVCTRFVPPAEPSGSWKEYYERWPFALRPETRPLWDLDEAWWGRASVASHTFSKWSVIRGLVGPEPRVVLGGVSTDCCVLATAWAAVDDGARVRVVSDACAAKTPQIHEAALASMASRAPQITIVTSAEEERRQRRRPARPLPG